LTNSALAAGSLVDAVRRQGVRLSDETGIAVTVEASPALPALSTAGEVVLLRGAQEAFANVRKHSRADTVTVRIAGDESGVRLSVADNGIGFDPSAGTDGAGLDGAGLDGAGLDTGARAADTDAGDARATGFGLPGMRSRARRIGATMTVDSVPGAGTTVRIEVPA
jgi:signal transduction histidine kinase